MKKTVGNGGVRKAPIPVPAGQGGTLQRNVLVDIPVESGHPPGSPGVGGSIEELLVNDRAFETLSVLELLEARDAYHYHLMDKPNVVGTAIGLYLIRDTDAPRVDGEPPKEDPDQDKPARELGRSSVRRYSWPCVLVFVREWVKRSDFRTQGGQLRPDRIVPKTLYLPNGRSVPVCVVLAPPGQSVAGAARSFTWPAARLGGGFPLFTTVQGQERVATVGCLVTDGHTTYALTNRHVTGPEGQPVSSLVRGAEVEIGRSSSLQLTRRPFTDVYPDYVGRRVVLNLDAGLVELKDVRDWTSDIYGIGPLGAIADVSENNITLKLIDAHVQAHGAASGLLSGRIKALFYRFKTLGGDEHVADFLIAPEGETQTQPGDSGAVWCLVPDPGKPLPKDGPPVLPRPLALEWGGQAFIGDGQRTRLQFSLATNLSSVCKSLGLDLVHAEDTAAQPFWGAFGHYSIAAMACTRVSAKFRPFFETNLTSISFGSSVLDAKGLKDAIDKAKKAGFVPLADVPDVVWKNLPSKLHGGRDTGFRSGPEHPTHFADVDEKAGGHTLLDLSLKNQHLRPADWQKFYDDIGHHGSRERGCLPFRVWQLFEEMVLALRGNDATRFLGVAGVLAHYVGDACQPLHGSKDADGFADQSRIEQRVKRDGTTEGVKVWPGQGVHSTYEEKMVDDFAEPLVKGVTAALDGVPQVPPPGDGRAAAMAVLQLMKRSRTALTPKKIIDTYITAGGGRSKKTTSALWKACGKATIEIMADGAVVLAALWDGALHAANLGSKPLPVAPIDRAALAHLYEDDPTFARSLDLDHIAPALSGV